jgi:hypothetical protein
MSASKTLEAMHAAIPRVPWATTPVTQLKAVADVMPQIIAVVKAAEKQRRDGYTLASCKRTSAALKDLEEVLP